MTGEDTDKQEPNRLETVWDSKEVAQLADIIEKTAKGWNDRSQAVKLLRGLCGLVAKDPECLNPTRDPEKWGFLALDIGESLRDSNIPGTDGWATDPEKAKSRMTDHWPKLEDIWERQSPTIVDALAAARISSRPRLHKLPGGGSGKNSKYGFRFDPLEQQADDEQLSDVDLLNVPQLRYRQEHISDNRMVHWMSKTGFYLGGWGGKVFIGVFIILLIITAFWSWLVLVAMSFASTTVAFLKFGLVGTLTVLIAYMILGWQMRLATNRVAFAPLLLQPFSNDDYLLELRKEDGATRNSMYLVRYVGDCPICGTKGRDMVRVESG